MRLYSIFDRKLREFGAIVVQPNDGACIRALSDGVAAQPQSLMAMHPEDFELRCLGAFDVETGEISPYVGTQLVAQLISIVQDPRNAHAPTVEVMHG